MITKAIKLHDLLEEKTSAFDSTGYLASLFYALSELSQHGFTAWRDKGYGPQFKNASLIEAAFEQLRIRKEDESVVLSVFDLLANMWFQGESNILKDLNSEQKDTIVDVFLHYLTKSNRVVMDAIIHYMRDKLGERFQEESIQSRYLFWTITHGSSYFVVTLTDAFLKRAPSSFKSNYILRGM
jgi:hypothetical protein